MVADSAVLKADAVPEGKDEIRRLILKDGSYELIREYVVEGDFVRYFSTERNDWEELPDALIDWPATLDFARRTASEALNRKRDALDKAADERRADEARTPLIAPGLRLPVPEGVFLLDVYGEKPELVRLYQNGADWHKNTGRNILRGVLNPIAGSRQTVELKGLRARIQSHNTTPEIYLFIDPNDRDAGYTSATARDHLRLVRCEKKKGNRVVVTYNIAIYGRVTPKAQQVKVKIEPVSEYWVRVAPLNPLPPGEYALVEWDTKGSVNQFVWDFGVDPLAPPNPAMVKTNPDRKEPVLIEKPAKK